MLEDTLEQDANGAYEVDGHDAGAGFRDLDSDEYTPLALAGLATFDVQ
ncbi:MAG: hypothetical protein ACLQHL_09875 [Candidatus Cybelea sp.]